MNWQKLQSTDQIQDIKDQSMIKPVLIFKHSTRCAVSSMSMNRVSKKWKPDDADRITPYLLDLISFREISNLVASEFSIAHQSPQILIVKEGKVVYTDSHFGISYSAIMSKL